MMEEKKLFLLDAYALIFRAYHAMKNSPRITSDGMNTSAIFGFVNTLEEVLRKEAPTHIAVCFDPAGKTFRHEMFPDYKAGREATPEDIKIAIPYIKDIIRAYGIPVVEVDGFEADDVIGTLAVKGQRAGFHTYIMSPDKDLSQLVGGLVRIYRPGYKGQPPEVRGEKEVCEVFGINRPSQVIDMLALMGDKVDNITGCPGVGEKTASKLILEFDSVENVIANTDRLKGALKEKIETHVDDILFSKKLATIRTDAPVELDEEAFARHPIDAESMRRIFERLEFRTLLSRVLGSKQTVSPPASKSTETDAEPWQGTLFGENSEAKPPVAEADGKYSLVAEPDVESVANGLSSAKRLGLHFLLTAGEPMCASVAGVAIATSADEAYYFPIPKNSREKTMTALRRLLESTVAEKVGTDLKRAMIALRVRDGIGLPAPYYDNGIAHYLLQPETSHSLERMTETVLHEMLPEYPMPEGVKPAKFDIASDLRPEEICRAACARACANLRLRSAFDERLAAEGMAHLLSDIELPLVEVLADMEMTGVRIDVGALKNYSAVLTQRMNEIEKECIELAGVAFNVASPAQVGEILFDRLYIDAKAKKTRTGQYSTTEEVLEKLTGRHPIVVKILEFRKLKKLLSTYVDALPELINPQTGKIHTTFNQTVTATGRLSSTNPNLQNIPIRNDDGREIRKAFIPDDGHVFFSADYSQIELRIVANVSGDEAMVEAFLDGEDIHRATAAKIFHENISDVTADQRRKAKTANFGMIYGISAFGLSERLQIPRSEAKSIIEGYFHTFPGVKAFMEESIEKSRQQGYVTTLFGRRRMLPDINSRNAIVRGYAERNAINAPIQGTAADIIKIAMVRIFRRFREEGIASKMILQVHDELNFDVLPEELARVSQIVKEEMENAYRGRVPLVADCGTGGNWLEAH